MITSETLPTIQAKRISLRWLTENDVKALYDIFSNDEVAKYWSRLPFTQLKEASELLESIHNHFRQQDLYQWGIAKNSDQQIIGTCTLSHVDANNRRAELGYALNRNYWGNGYMGEALVALIDYAFVNLNLHRLEADVDPRNEKSIRALESLGFKKEGFLRERWQVGGSVQDAFFYGLLEQDWKK